MAEELIAGRYRLLEPLGRGAMSSVWRADDEELARQVAVKLLSPSAEPERFEREARAAASLSHPNIVQVFDYGKAADGRPFMVLELLPGGSLEDRLRERKPLPDDETRRIALALASGLAHAHANGLVHRDLKPANVLFDGEGRAKIADFGIARMHGTGTLTDAGTVLGTASYISPEQASGTTAGPASDVYSLGVILFRMLTGALPFESANAMELVRLHRDAPPPAVTDVRADAPPALAALTAAELAKDPGARPADGAAVLALLQGDGAPTAATRLIAPPPRRRRSPVVPAVVLGLLLLAGGAVAAVALTGGGSSHGTTSSPGLSLPSVSSEGSTTSAPTTAPALQTTTAARTSTAQPPTSAPTTTAAPPPTTSASKPPTTTATAPTTTAAPPTTTEPPTTTVDTTSTAADTTTTTEAAP